MNAPIRVMLVDDSSVVRRMLAQALAAHSEVEVVGTAANGIIALQKLPLLNPEVVLLDVEMPEMDGITTMQNLRARYPRLPVIMFSTLTERGANVTFDALAAGASDYVLKPSTQSGETLEKVVASYLVPKIIGLARSRFGLAVKAVVDAASQSFDSVKQNNPFETRPTGTRPMIAPPTSGSHVLSASAPNFQFAKGLTAAQFEKNAQKPLFPVKTASEQEPTTGTRALSSAEALFAPKTGTLKLPASSPTKTPSLATNFGRKPVQIIAIAASTGGPNALAGVIPRLPGKLPIPIVIVQHMPPIFTRCLADRLAARSELKIVESAGNERLQPGSVYIAPGHRHLEVERDGDGVRTLLTDGAPENSCRPAADVLFRSLVRAYGGGVLCVILTGMGQDGLRGAREIHEAGGRVLVQSGPTCVIWGMPKVVEESGIAEAVVPLPDMAASILQRVGHGLLAVRGPEGTR